MTSCLVVDDSQVVRTVARRILRDLDITVSEAENGAEALERCEVAMPDVILLDWNMPVMNGISFLRELRGKYGNDQPIVVFCTTENGLPNVMEALEAGANEYIMKPFDETIIRSKLQQVGLLQ
ncbi:MAG: response regulator [Alphaproteobacteria bacterium]